MLCLAAMTCAQAMELTFWLGDKKIEPGTTAEFTEVTVDDYGDYKEVFMVVRYLLLFHQGDRLVCQRSEHPALL